MKDATPKSKTPRFPRVPASRCACCGTRLETGEGYDVPAIGAVGPKCVQKFGGLVEPLTDLATTLTQVEGLTVAASDGQTVIGATHRLIMALRRVGFEVRVERLDGVSIVHVGARTAKYQAMLKSWAQVRAEFVRDLQVAAGARAEAVAA